MKEEFRTMDNGKFALRIEGVKQEKTGKRFQDYMNWHKKLGSKYKTQDVSFVETRRNRGVVAIFSVQGTFNDENHIENSKKYIFDDSGINQKVEMLRDLSREKRFAAYYVLHTIDMSRFQVWDVKEAKQQEWKKMSLDDYSSFIKNL